MGKTNITGWGYYFPRKRHLGQGEKKNKEGKTSRMAFLIDSLIVLITLIEDTLLLRISLLFLLVSSL